MTESESPPELFRRIELTSGMHDVAKLVVRLDKEGRARLKDRRVQVTDLPYGRFSISIRDPLAPPELQDTFFFADFESEQFDYKDILQPGLRAKEIVRNALEPRTPVNDEVAELLRTYVAAISEGRTYYD